MPDPLSLSAVEQAELVRSGGVSSRELVDASLAAIDRLNGELNAVVTLAADRARTEADAVRARDPRPLAGVPIVVKDLLALTEGIRTSFGTRASGEFVPPLDSAVVRRLRAAGAIVVGKTNVPEFGILPVTEPLRFGPCRNPWDPDRTPGGSSGGSAAAVAAGMVALGHANDGAGSIRIPAACCGLVGLKPARGRISQAPLANDPLGIITEGVVTRTVLDTAVALDLLAGPEPGDPYLAAAPSAPFAEAVGRDPGRLRVAFTIDPPNRAEVHPEAARAVRETAELLATLGHEVTERAPNWSDPGYTESFLGLWAADVASAVTQVGFLRGRAVDSEELEPLTQALVEQAGSLSAVDYITAVGRLRGLARALAPFWDDHDVLLTPTVTGPAIPIGALEPDPGGPAIQTMAKASAFAPFGAYWNVTGQPAVSLPLHETPEGLPVGVQFVGSPAGEELLLSLAGQLEGARPWAGRIPGLSSGRPPSSR